MARAHIVVVCIVYQALIRRLLLGGGFRLLDDRLHLLDRILRGVLRVVEQAIARWPHEVLLLLRLRHSQADRGAERERDRAQGEWVLTQRLLEAALHLLCLVLCLPAYLLCGALHRVAELPGGTLDGVGELPGFGLHRITQLPRLVLHGARGLA